jgi:hypothetical protein
MSLLHSLEQVLKVILSELESKTASCTFMAHSVPQLLSLLLTLVLLLFLLPVLVVIVASIPVPYSYLTLPTSISTSTTTVLHSHSSTSTPQILIPHFQNSAHSSLLTRSHPTQHHHTPSFSVSKVATTSFPTSPVQAHLNSLRLGFCDE